MPTPPPSSYAQQLIRADAAPVTVASAYAMQKIELRLSDDPALAARVIRLLPAALARDVADDVLAHRELARLTPPRPLSAFRTGPAAAAAKLRAWYLEAQRRSGVAWQLLAAVNFVESDFGRMREASVAGAQGPMQFMPSSWRTYGLGGNVHDPHDAILGAANYLRAAGARRDIRAALHAYNPSRYYVDAVLRYARDITADVDNFYDFYAWQVYVKTPSGSVRLTGPGLHNGHSPTRENPRRS
jgi:membrane-bound lytic murein transglycosylase MltF